MTSHNITRRRAMSATGVTVAAMAVAPEGSLAESPTPIVFKDRGYRLYCLLPHDPYFNVQHEDLPKPFGVYSGQQTRPARGKPSAFVWATAEQSRKIHSKRFEKLFGTLPLQMKTPKDVCEFGPRKQAKHTLYILLAPNAIHAKHPTDATFESVDQIVAKWREVTKRVPGLSIESFAPTPPKPRTNFQQIIVPGQIRVKFDGQLPNETLDYFRRHPQTIRIQWAEPFTTMYCPPCGLG